MKTPYQIYKDRKPQGSIQEFNDLSLEEKLPYRVESAEGSLTEHVEYVTDHPDEKDKYSISSFRAACTYISEMGIFIPLMRRFPSAPRMQLNITLLRSVVQLWQLDETPLKECESHLTEPNKLLSREDIAAVEKIFADAEQVLRLQAKKSGAKIELLRKRATPKGGPSEGEEHMQNIDLNNAESALEEKKEMKKVKKEEEEGGAVSLDAPKSEKKASRRSGTTEKEDGAPPAQKRKTEEVKRITTKASAIPSGGTTLATSGKQKQLSNQEKKIIVSIQQLIQLLAHVYAMKCNELVPIFDFLVDKVKQLENQIEQYNTSISQKASEPAPPPPPPPPSDTSTGTTTTTSTSVKAATPIEVDFSAVREALATSNRTFREEEACQIEFDEDLLHPISYALLVELNRLEGFLTLPMPGPTEEEKARKKAAHEALRLKREEVRRKAEAKQREKEAQVAERARELQVLRQLLGASGEEELHEEDMRLMQLTEAELREHPELVKDVPYVHYPPTLPLESAAEYDKALYIWTMITSLPKPFRLSKMPFKLFLQALHENREEENGLMEEISFQLMEGAKESSGSHSPTGLRLNTRGKPWFTCLVEFVASVSGNKKKRAPVKKRVASDSSSSSSEEEEAEEEMEEEMEEEDDDEEEDWEDDEKEDPDEDKQKKKKKKKKGPKKTPTEEEKTAIPTIAFEDELRESMIRVNELGNRASWGNTSMPDRLNLLQFCVLEALRTEKVCEDADRLQKESDDTLAAMEKAQRDMRDEAEKELRQVWKLEASSARREGEGKKKSAAAIKKEEAAAAANPEKKATEEAVNEVIHHVNQKRSTLFATWLQKQDDELDGTLLLPLGSDRFGRLYWRFPLDYTIHVQTPPTAFTATTLPLIPYSLPTPRDFTLSAPSVKRLLDDEEDEQEVKPVRGLGITTPSQTAWGVIPAHYLPQFIQGLDVGGKREGPLRRALEGMQRHLQFKSADSPNFTRLTRSRHHLLGYSNQLKPRF